jgi:DNA topoisomerase-1
MDLVIVESPTKARKLAQFLSKKYIIEASMGHVRDLPRSKMGVDVAGNFEPDYEISDGKKATIKKLRDLAKDAEIVYLATDPDREGEAIAWHIQYLLTDTGKSAKKRRELQTQYKRATFHEITKEAVTDAIDHPTTLNMDLVDAQQARRVLDRIVGYYLSPVLWKKVRRGLSAGRVQSVALRLIVDKEKEREAFKQEEYWEVTGIFSYKTASLTAKLHEIDGKSFEPKQVSDVEGVREWVKAADYHIDAIDETKKSRSAPPPLITSTMQQAAASKYGWAANSTMRLAQSLYEEGFITYHRTDSTNLSVSAVEMVCSHISAKYGKEYLPDKPNNFAKKSKNAQEAHEAIRPTSLGEEIPNRILSKNSEQAKKLYELIRARFIASQMTPTQSLITSVKIRGVSQDTKNNAVFAVSGTRVLFDGWTSVLPSTTQDPLPEITKGDPAQLNDLQEEQKFTQPPSRYSDASLIKTLEQLGIGRPSTYASIISVILDRGYVERQDKAFLPTQIGRTVCDFLQLHFPQQMDYDFTANMEESLDEISRGEKKWRAVMKTFFEPFEKTVVKATGEAERMKIPVEETGDICPDCKEGKIVIRTGRFGKFYSCARFPECKYTARYMEKVENMSCPTCGQGDVVIKRTKRGRQFYGCSRYPTCDFASWNKPGTAGDAEGSDGKTKKWSAFKSKEKETVSKRVRVKTPSSKRVAAKKTSSKKPAAKKTAKK